MAEELALQLQQIQEEIGSTGVPKILAAAKKRNIKVTKEQVQRFLSTKGESQIFLPLPPSTGKVATEGPYVRLQMDLGDMRNQISKGNAAFLLIVNVFTREAYTRPVKTRKLVTYELALSRFSIMNLRTNMWR